MNKPIFYVFCLFCIASTDVQAQTLRDSVISLQKTVHNLKNEHDSLRLSEINAKQLELRIEKNDFELRRDYNWLISHGFTFGLAGLVALFVVLYSAYQAITRWAIKQAEEKIRQHFEHEDNILKREKKILVLTPEKQSIAFIKQFFREMHFRMPDFELIGKADLKFNDFQLIFINDEEDIINNEQIHIILRDIGGTVSVFYFGGLQLQQDIKSKKQFSSCQFKSQIYGNLLNALRFQKLLSNTS